MSIAASIQLQASKIHGTISSSLNGSYSELPRNIYSEFELEPKSKTLLRLMACIDTGASSDDL